MYDEVSESQETQSVTLNTLNLTLKRTLTWLHLNDQLGRSFACREPAIYPQILLKKRIFIDFRE